MSRGKVKFSRRVQRFLICGLFYWKRNIRSWIQVVGWGTIRWTVCPQRLEKRSSLVVTFNLLSSGGKLVLLQLKKLENQTWSQARNSSRQSVESWNLQEHATFLKTHQQRFKFWIHFSAFQNGAVLFRSWARLDTLNWLPPSAGSPRIKTAQTRICCPTFPIPQSRKSTSPTNILGHSRNTSRKDIWILCHGQTHFSDAKRRQRNKTNELTDGPIPVHLSS